MKAGELFVEIKIDGAEKATTALAKVEKSLKQTSSVTKDLTKYTKEVFSSAGSMESVIGGAESAISSVAGMLGPLGTVATGIAAAGYAAYKFVDSAGQTALQFSALQATTGFPEHLASQYEEAAQSVGVSAGTMLNAINGVATASNQITMSGVIPDSLVKLQQFTGKELGRGTAQDPKKLFEYIIDAIQGSKLSPLQKKGFLASTLGITDPIAQAAFIRGRGLSPGEVAKQPGLNKINELTNQKLALEKGSTISKFVATDLGAAGVHAAVQGVEKLGETASFTAGAVKSFGNTILDMFNHPKKVYKGGPAESPTGIPKGAHPQQILKDKFKLKEGSIVGKTPGSFASTTNISKDKTTTVNVQLSTLASADDAASAIFRVARLSHAQVYVT